MRLCTANESVIKQAVNLLHQGCLVAFPTETVYGLGADASNPEAVARIFAAKGRPANHPLIVHIADSACLSDWAENIPDNAFKLAEHFWPGPLAIILNKKDCVPMSVTGGQNTVGLRVPNHPVALQLLREFGGGIAAPSANRFCRISPTQAAHVAEELGDAVDLILDGGACEVGVESTIIDLSGNTPRLLRYGYITVEQIQAVLQTELIVPGNAKQIPSDEIRAPGMMAVHYAPLTTALLCPSDHLQNLINTLTSENKKIAVMSYQTSITETSQIYVIKMPATAETYAQYLYAALRELDHQQHDVIVVEQPPTGAQWSAINDRLEKATLSAR
ncbi:L-threonylcarbamoyladenylate synthase [Crenothrix polyspora]|uniref:Threonylcarbamoyl-AMP synthase n=1 Tax=Crenothrix polyspora TaxID=360316 RepID=A0A1R4H4X9_9GAMM|nr:L-threonylcarbamoyladenylate synthase [Crenothrix polyspora]SJM91313.1 Threonylcarbamoyl-AMP synthase [Crenothrix polyspora]